MVMAPLLCPKQKTDMEILNKAELPLEFEYPSEFMKIVNQGLLDLDPWIILHDDYLRERFKGLKDRYKSRTLIPFGRRLDRLLMT